MFKGNSKNNIFSDLKPTWNIDIGHVPSQFKVQNVWTTPRNMVAVSLVISVKNIKRAIKQP